MSVIQTGLFTLFERFPDRRKAIKRLFEQSEAFKILCSDHQKCLAAIHHWRQFQDSDSQLRRREYDALIRELEEEISEALDRNG